VQTIAKPKPLPRQLLELAPRLIVPAAALAVLIAISTGGLMPGRNSSGASSMGGGPTRQLTTYRAFVETGGTIVPGQPWPLSITLLDQFGRPLTDFDFSGGGPVYVTAIRRDLAYLAETLLASAVDGVLRPELIFPAEGQYVVFVDFTPRGGSEKQATVSIVVGAASTPAAALTPDVSFVQVDALRVSLKSDGPLTANQPAELRFEATDAQGRLLTEDVQALSGSQIQLEVVDETLTTLLRPDFIDRQRLQFSVNFPRPGKYKVWLSFWNPDRRQQVAFVVDVK
jgi:hypothetical protein